MDIRIGEDVSVVSGPHEGRNGRVIQLREMSINNADPEPWAIVEFSQRNCFDEVDVDQISVPVRRLAQRRQ
jgi:hypothetical protein